MKLKTYNIIILPVVLYGCEIMSLTLRKEYRLRNLKTGCWGGIFGPKKDEIIWGWKKLHNEIHKLYFSPNIMKTVKSRTCNTNGEEINAYRVWVGKSEGNRPLGIPRNRWEDNIKMDFTETGWGGIDWINLAQDRYQWRGLLNTVVNLQVP
jgi:hypothetical protein